MTTNIEPTEKQKQEKLENEMVCGNFISYQLINLLDIWQLTVPGFTHLVVHQKKDSVYTPMGGSPTINVMVYALFGG